MNTHTHLAVALAIGLLCSARTASGQLGFGSPATVNAAPNSVSYCDTDPTGFFDINWQVNGAVDYGEIMVILPTGARILGGSKQDVNTSPAGLTTGLRVAGDTLRFVLRNRGDGDAGTIRYKLHFDCRVDSVFQEPYEMPVSAITGTDTFSVRTSPLNSTGSRPVLGFAATPESTIREAIVGNTYSREFDVVQSGQRSRAYSFLLCMSYGSNLAVTGQTLEGVPIDFGAPSGGCLLVKREDYPALPWPFEQGDRWRFRESVTVKACTGINTNARTRFNCGPTLCQEDVYLPLEILLEDQPPTVRLVDHSRTLPADGCVAEGARIEAEYEVTGKVYKAQFFIQGYHEGVYIDTNTIEVDWGDGTYRAWTGGYIFSENVDSRCDPGRSRSLSLEPLSDILDARAAPLRVRVRYNVKWCCEASAESGLEGNTLYGYLARLTVRDQCNVAQYRDIAIGSYSLHADGSSDFPSRISDGETADFIVDIDELRISREIRDSSRMCFDYDLPDGLTIAPGAVATITRFNGWRPIDVPVEDLSGGRYRACFGQEEFHANGATMRVPVTYACTPALAGTTVTASATASLRLGDGCDSPDECGIHFFTVEGQVALGSECATAPCDGIEHVGATVTRTTFGAPDNDGDGRADVGDTLDMTVVRRDHAMEGDVIALTSAAVINTAAPAGAFDYVTAEVRWDVPHRRIGDPTLVIYDASAGTTHACGTVDVEQLDTVTYRYRFLASGLRGCDGLPGDFSFERGDSLWLNNDFVVTDNPGCFAGEVTATLDWYADRSAGIGADRLQCNLPDLAKYKSIGYEFFTEPYYSREYGCAGTHYEYRIINCVGGATHGSAFWPGEVRPYGVLATTEMQVPMGMRFDSIQARYINTTRVPAYGVSQQNLDLTPYVEVVGDIVRLDWDAVRRDSVLDMQDGLGYHMSLRGYFGGSCASERSLVAAAATVRYDYPEAGGFPDRLERRDDTYEQPVRAFIPAASLTTSTPDISPYDHRATWNLSLRESRGAAMPNTWVAFRSTAGVVVPAEVRYRGDVIAPVDGLYRLGDLRASSVNELIITIDYSACAADSLVALTGWECQGYPASATAVDAGDVVCEPLTLTLRMQPEQPSLQQAIVDQPAGPVDACTELTYEVEIVNSGRAVIYEPTFEVYVPYGGGLEIVAGSERAAYPSPSDPSDADFAIALGAPFEVSVTPLGRRYVWDLEALIPAFDRSDNRGWNGRESDDDNERRLRVRFGARTTCDFIGGDFVSFIARGRSHCGQPVRTVLRNGEAVEFEDVQVPYSATHELSVPPVIDVCAAGSTVELAGEVTFFGDTDGRDAILFALPPSLEFVRIEGAGGAFGADVVITEVPPTAGTGGASFQELRIPVSDDVPAFRKIEYTVVARVRPDGLLCEEPNVAYLRSVREATFSCNGETCDGTTTSGVLLPVPTFTFARDTFAAADLHLAASCGADSLRLDGLTVTNLGDRALNSTIGVAIYRDLDGNGRLSDGDEPVALFEADASAAPGATVSITAPAVAITDALDACSLIGVIEGCGCDRFELPVLSLHLDNAGARGAPVCSTEPAGIGCAEGLPGYMYTWSAAAGSAVGEVADAQAASTSITYLNSGREPVTLTYVLTSVSPGGCVSTDTARVDVLPSCTTIGDYVWVDVDADGLQTEGEPPLQGVTVNLYSAADPITALGTETTNAAGRYAFAEMPAGDYFVEFDASTSRFGDGTTFTKQGSDPLAADDSDVDADGRSRTFSFDPNDGPITSVDAGVIVSGELASILHVTGYERIDGDIVEAHVRLGVRNAGRQPLTDLAIQYLPAEHLGAAFREARVGPGATGTVASAPNPTYDGQQEGYVVDPALGVSLSPDSEAFYEVRVRFDARLLDQGVLTQALITGRVDLGGNSSGKGSVGATVSDYTDGGSEFAAPNPGFPGDTGGTDDPWLIACTESGLTVEGVGATACQGSTVTLGADHDMDGDPELAWFTNSSPDEEVGRGSTLTLTPAAGDNWAEVSVIGITESCYYDLAADIAFEAVEIPNLITPNGDGVDDQFRVPCLEGRASASLTVFNRWGDPVYFASEYRNDYDGYHKGNPLPDGTYYYVLDVDAGTQSAETISGYIFIVQ